MSYRRSNFRKIKKAAARGDGRWTPADAQRVAAWAALPLPPRPPGWGKPKARVAIDIEPEGEDGA